MERIYGYVRVSTKEQNEDRQLAAMKAEGLQNAQIYIDKQSGQNFARPQYIRLLKRLRAGDLLIIKSIDRMGRDYDEILRQWKYITRDVGAYIKVLDMPLLDTWQHKDLMGTLISDIVLQLLSFVAQHERESIHQRQAEGICEALKNGVRFGRPRIVLRRGYKGVFRSWQRGKLSAIEAAHQLGISRTTFYRRANEMGFSRTARYARPPAAEAALPTRI